MEKGTLYGYFVLADISGYTSYLAGVELVHARDVLTELLEQVVDHLQPLLTIAELEGDAVFAYAPGSRIPRDETLLQVLESTYLAFRDRVESICRRTTCPCNACRAIPSLDLKFIVHYGEYLSHHVSGITKLVGSDVNLAHRLLKNHVSEATGWQAYVLFTEAALTQLNLEGEGLHRQIEEYEHLGPVKTRSLDLHARYKQLTESRRVVISPQDADVTISRMIPAPPQVVWGWMNDVQKRLRWETFDDIRPLVRPGGRTGAGARNHCAHGKNVVTETILDWRPFEYYTVEYPMGIQSRHLTPGVDGTRLDIHFQLKAPLPVWLRRPLVRLMFKQLGVKAQFEKMARLIAEDAAKDPSS